MSAESQESLTVASKSIFNDTRIKKESNDVCVVNRLCQNVDGDVTGDSDNVKFKMEPQRALGTPICTTPRSSNGFHNEDLLRDILAEKFATLAHHTPAAKHEKIRLMIEESIENESRSRVQEIFSQIEQLKLEEKLLLYLKLPLSLSNNSGTIDPLRQPLNPLGNRYEIHQTIMWIKTHLEEDPDVSLPKQEVYDEYKMFCVRNAMKPLSTADFGKVMKQVYPRVRPRRLGTRGNSRYCYAGMRKKIKLDPPKLPIITNYKSDDNAEENINEEMLGAASIIIREWAESLLHIKFSSLSALGRYLVDNLCVDTRSLAAVCILCGTGSPDVKNETSKSLVTGKSTKLREAQLQLQKKLQQRESSRDQKRYLENESPSQNKEKTVNSSKGGNKASKKKTNQPSPQGTNICQGSLLKASTTPVPRHRKIVRNNNSQTGNGSLQSNCDNLVVQSIESVQRSGDSRSPKESTKPNRNPRKRASIGSSLASQTTTDLSPEKQLKLAESNSGNHSLSMPNQQDGKVSVILASNLLNHRETDNNQSRKSCDNQLTRCSNSHSKLNGRSSVISKNTSPLLDSSTNTSNNLRTIDPDSLDDYLNGGNNSQEQEEELLQYFQQANSTTDLETGSSNGGGGGGGGGDLLVDTELTSRSDKVSQLRLILQQNLKATTSHPQNPSIPANVIHEKEQALQKLILPALSQNQSNTRRRVSFETNVVEHPQESSNIVHTVPQSPNTRRRIFNFTPISPGPHSPINGRASKSSSANASPFVSPRNTPVPRSRSNLQGGCRSRAAKKILARSISCSVPYTNSKNDTFVVPTSGPESLRQQTSLTRSPLVLTKSSETQVGTPQSLHQLTKREQKRVSTSESLIPELDPEKQLVINYPSQENLQEVKNMYQKTFPTDQEITDLLHSEKLVEILQPTKDQLYFRSQSVPLHRMINPNLMSPISTQNFSTPRSFNPSTSSSIAPTPVPSEFNDFSSIDATDSAIYLLGDCDPNFMSEEQQFLMADKEITSDNISNFLNILDEGSSEILHSSVDQGEVIESSTMILDSLPNSDLSLAANDSALDSGIGMENGLQKIIESRSYPNTPLPMTASSFVLSYSEDSNGSRSHPPTPLNNVHPKERYSESNEPMLSSPTLETLNLRGDLTTTTNSSESVCQSVDDFLDSGFLGNVDADADDLNPLGNFEGLHDVDSLTPLFTEVVEPNR